VFLLLSASRICRQLVTVTVVRLADWIAALPQFGEIAVVGLALSCYQAKKWVGAFASALGGIDVFVFAGGIGENAPQIRAWILAGLDFVGIELDPSRNERSDGLISADSSRVRVRVLRTDEELMIARQSLRVVHQGIVKEPTP
jgi:acetate kinase